jgi:hypothetical protein
MFKVFVLVDLLAANYVAIVNAADTIKINRMGRGIQATGGTGLSDALTLVVSGSATGEYACIEVNPTVTGPANSYTLTYPNAFVTTPTVYQGVRPFVSGSLFSELTLTSATTVSTTTSTFSISGINSTTLGSLRFMVYGNQRTGVLSQ